MKQKDVSNQFLERFKNFIVSHNLIQQGEKILVGVSGGVDSISLLHCLIEIKKDFSLELMVSHFDHRIRRESLEDALFVYRFCKERGIPFIYSTIPVKDFANREKIGLELAGRILRYKTWNRLLEKYALNKIALAHHLDDLVEEVFLRLLRGSGKRGLAGIPLKKGPFIRPFLCFTKEEIINFAKNIGLNWKEDQSNQNLIYTRNKIRHLLIPFLEKHFKNFKKEIFKNSLILQEEENFLENLAQESLKQLIIEKSLKKADQKLVISLSKFKNLHPVLQKRILFVIFGLFEFPSYKIKFSHFKEIKKLLDSKKREVRLNLSENFIVEKLGDALIFSKNSFLPKAHSKLKPCFIQSFLEIKKEGIYQVSEDIKIEVKCISSPEKDWGKLISSKHKNLILLSSPPLDFPFIIRTRKEGDRIYLPGVGHKKLKKFLSEKKIPLSLRSKLLIVEHKNQIVAIENLYIHPEYQINSKNFSKAKNFIIIIIERFPFELDSKS